MKHHAARITVAQGSLTDGDEAVLVNASNTEVALGSGVSAAIRAACGPGYQDHIRALLEDEYRGSMAPGDILVTDAGAHPRARYVVHAAVMDYRGAASALESSPDAARVRKICEALWPAVDALDGATSVAMVALGAGVGGLGVRAPTEIACETLREHLRAHPDSPLERVVFYGYDLVQYAAIAEVVDGFFPLGDDVPADVRRMWDTR